MGNYITLGNYITCIKIFFAFQWGISILESISRDVAYGDQIFFYSFFVSVALIEDSEFSKNQKIFFFSTE